MSIFRYATADDSPVRQTVVSGGREFLLSLFSDDDLLAVHPNARAELRSKPRGVLLLSALIRDLQKDVTLDVNTGIYLYCGFGPFSPRTQEVALRAPLSERLTQMERSLPPKDIFISTPSLKAAHISIEFSLHGPWMTFSNPQFGLSQALHYALGDLRDEVVEGALIGGIFTLDEPIDRPNFLKESSHLCECVAVQYLRPGEQPYPFPEGPLGKYGPLTSTIERTRQHERNEQ